MATTSDPRASGFNEAEFRSAIKFAMNMGAPEATEQRATFRWPVERTFAQADASGNAYNWTAVPTSETELQEVQVDCAVEFIARPAGSVDTPLGQFDISRIQITLLDSDYELVEGATEIQIDNNLYDVDFVAPPEGLFGVTIHSIYASARDES